MMKRYLFAAIPLIPSATCALIIFFKDSDFVRIFLCSLLISVFGYVSTTSFIPIIAKYTAQKGLSGKDLGKKVYLL